jgi:hypothetical protein
VLTVNTETGETACVLHLKIPQRIHPWRDTVKGKDREKQEKEEGGPYPPSPRLLVTISKLSRSTIIAGDPYRKKPQR